MDTDDVRPLLAVGGGPFSPTFMNLGTIALFASERHRNQRRKDGSPYFGHLTNVSWMAACMGGSHVTPYGSIVCAAAGYLHDVIRDQGVDFDDVVEISNLEVAVIVAMISDDKRLPGPSRHRRYANRLSQATPLAQVVKLADILDDGQNLLKLLEISADHRAFVAHEAKENLGYLEVLDMVRGFPEYVVAQSALELALTRSEQ